MEGFSLFDFSREGVEQNGLMLYHSRLFDTAESVDIYIRFAEHDQVKIFRTVRGQIPVPLELL